MGNLSENSSSYYDKNKWYEIFSIAEDYPKLIDKFFLENIKTETILDAGCGTGKYTKLFSNISKNYIGIDKSQVQINTAKSKFNVNYITSDLNDIPLENKSINITICPWVLGTIPEEKRKEVIKELIRVTKNKIILIENLPNSDFEYIRGHNLDGTTEKYLSFLKNNKFKLHETINTYFKFETIEDVQNVFLNIYNKQISNRINSNIIKHDVGIYILEDLNDL